MCSLLKPPVFASVTPAVTTSTNNSNHFSLSHQSRNKEELRRCFFTAGFSLKQYLLSARVTNLTRSSYRHAQTRYPKNFLSFFHLPVAVNCCQQDQTLPFDANKETHLSVQAADSFVQITWQLKTAFPLPWSNLSLRSLICKTALFIQEQ